MSVVAPQQVVEYLEEKIEKGQFYVIYPVGDVGEEMSRKRMLWSAGDVVQGRKPLSRWRHEDEELTGILGKAQRHAVLVRLHIKSEAS